MVNFTRNSIIKRSASESILFLMAQEPSMLRSIQKRVCCGIAIMVVACWYGGLFANTSNIVDVHGAPKNIRIISEDDFKQEEFNSLNDNTDHAFVPYRINSIIVQGTSLVSAVLSKVPYHSGEIFRPEKSAQLIKEIYALGYFLPEIKVEIEESSVGFIDVYIVVQEKCRIEELRFEGNSNVKREDIDKKIQHINSKALTEDDLYSISRAIIDLYKEKGYHKTSVATELCQTAENRGIAYFRISEGKPSVVKRVFFKGNHCVPSKVLRSLIFTREDWLFSFFDKAGTYQPDAVELGDKYAIEGYYQTNGFLMARVYNIITDIDPETNYVSVTFCIEEGELYTVKSVAAAGNELLSEPEILAYVGIHPGELYSRERVRQALERLRLLWGEHGYIYASIEPFLEPDEKNKTVSISFHTVLGSPVTVNRVSIVGNKKTCDNVIRRNIILEEGDILTTQKLDESRRFVEQLGFFDRQNGVSWKTERLTDELANLELVVKEIKTGKASAQIGYGGLDHDKQSASGEAINIGATFQNTNFLGRGITYSLNGTYSRQDYGFNFSLANPRIYDLPIGMGLDIFHRTEKYDDMHHTQSKPKERNTGAYYNVTFTPRHYLVSQVLLDFGVQNINYGEQIMSKFSIDNRRYESAYQKILDLRFQSGNMLWLGATALQDYRNHPIYPSRGYQWAMYSKLGIPHGRDTFGFFKWEADAHWYAPIINEYDLIFHAHGHIGFVRAFPHHTIPYRELFHIGGLSTVRGFLFGQIGPSFLGDSLGAENAFFFNFEMLFPIRKDMSIRGVFFYDGGAGWETPEGGIIPREALRNNSFNFRHSIGFGIRMTNPTPLRLDIGFKLDRNRKRGESISEIHMGSSVEF
jgi:outer membrane protein insertion porin family